MKRWDTSESERAEKLEGGRTPDDAGCGMFSTSADAFSSAGRPLLRMRRRSCALRMWVKLSDQGRWTSTDVFSRVPETLFVGPRTATSFKTTSARFKEASLSSYSLSSSLLP